ncbi:hypothetical protein HBI56_058900 [Parastagonospora nodorum]|nr:hypothetical protein HBI03_148750 [Parastagonospora nodorum]KAH4277351.1 hypothetical protein HBI04_093410 [Parastagonospora nodorum]KAH4347197.1 hypothetical protein HBH98_090430 [Parastagonospora nodorum]KAH4389100.1 hypothetical protein HBH97_056980 [Parastagonospora nodorum]KAH4396639.1 hypothetical protein HBH99_124210 [Parastagonospora nodorum]
MGGAIYTEEQLLGLRASPLVKKPDGLPSISQWMDVPADQSTTNNSNHASNNGTARRARGMREGEGPAGNERPPLINPMGQFGRRQSMQPGEETTLGPPKLSFISASRNAPKAQGETKERTGIVSVDGDNLGDRFPREKNDRWTRDRDPDRARDKTYTNGRRGVREDGEGWTNVKGRKSVGQEDFERFTGRNGDRNRDKQEGDPETDTTPRRGNRDRAEPRWGRREDTKDEGTKPGLQGGWRERDRDRERDRERDWTRGNNRAEEDPEWMDTKVEKKEFKPRTQEDFQRWKESMKANKTTGEDKDEPLAMPTEVSTAISATVPPMLTQPLHTPSGAEPTQGILFGNWGRDKAVDINAAEMTSAKPKPDKKSRFMTMFAKPEEPAAPAQPMAPSAMSPPPVMEGNADKEGFQRILQMLGQVNVSGAPVNPGSPPPPSNGGMRHGGGISLEFHQQTPPPEPQSSRPPRTMEQQNILENILAQRPDSRPSQQARFSNMSPENAPHEQFRHPRAEPSISEEHFHQQPLSRNATIPDQNLAALLSSRARDESHRDQAVKQRERDFLLNLMQGPARATPPQQMSNHNLPRQTPDNHLAAFFDQPRQQPQAPPKGRPGLPPGFMDDPRMFNENEMARLNAERREQELRQQINMQQQQEAMRAKNGRVPMGFPGHEDQILGLQRRNTGGDSRQMTNMGIPSQPVPDMQFMGGRGQPGMPSAPQERPNIAPPPGFGGGPMRQPPGLNGPNPQQQMGLGGPNFSAGNTPLGHPPGFAPPGNMRGMGFPGGPGGPGGNGMQGPPQGYFPPPGYGPPMPGMRGEDPRMMFDGHQAFGGPGPRQQQGRPGPPGMY